MGECLDWHLLKAAHKALHDEHWPTNLRLEMYNMVDAYTPT